jgi:hypothetical protein
MILFIQVKNLNFKIGCAIFTLPGVNHISSCIEKECYCSWILHVIEQKVIDRTLMGVWSISDRLVHVFNRQVFDLYRLVIDY